MGAGQFDPARASLEEARELNVHLGNRQKAGECTVGLGMLAGAAGDLIQARGHIEEALTTFRNLEDEYYTALTERLVGGFDRIEGNDGAAERHYRASLRASRQHDLPIVTASALYAFADLALMRGQPERALRIAGASDALREQLGEASPLEMAMVGDVRGAARSSLDEGSADRIYQEGRAMELDAAVTYAFLEQKT